MCGIVGVVGNNNAVDILMQGLEKLEYRGYDSAGIFVNNAKGNKNLIKSVGRIAKLREKIGMEVAGTAGIGHTRWATHGQPSEENSHPHASADGEFVLVHNGVIENYLEIKAEYLSDYPFKSETDTEVAVALIAKFANEGLSIIEAFKKALHIIEGSYAFALMDENDPDVIYVAKNKSPLLIGLGDGYNMVCSDAMAMIRETNEFMEIHDKELVVLTKNNVEITDYDGNKVERDSYIAELDLSDIGKGTYPFYMLKEIDEQPSVMRKLITKYANEDGSMNVDPEIVKAVQDADRIYIIAAGTSYNAGYASKRTLEALTDTPVELGVASEWGYDMPLLSEKPFFIYLSQSGETADSRQVLVKTNERKIPSLTVTNVPGSTLSREATYTMLLHAGPEIAVASTKAYTGQIAALTFLAKAVGEANNKSEAFDFDLVKELSIAAQSIEATLSEKELIEEKVNEVIADSRNAFYIGRAEDYYVAMEASLKLKEVSYIQCEGFAAGELKHGTIALIEEGTPVIALISNNPKVSAHTRGNIMEVAARGASVLTVVEESMAKEDDDIIVTEVHPYLAPIAMVIPTQLIAYYASIARGLDVDKPRNLAKAVTVE